MSVPQGVEEPDVLVQNGVEMPDTTNEAFTLLNGRTVYDNGAVRIWRCPHCTWWCRWQDAQCSVCGATRDGDAQQAASPELVGQAAS